MNPKTKQNKTKQNKTKQYELFEPVKVFIALMLVAIMWLLPVAFPQAEDSSDKKPNTDSPFIVPKAGAGWTCFDNPNCWEWACAEVIRGGCLRYEQKCTCTHEGGGGGPSYSPPTISHTFNCSVPGWGDWCIGSFSIELSASDPQNASLIISGDVNGNPSTGSGQVFTCTENPCTIDLSEGAGTVNYKVDASTGLSDSDSTAYYVDVTTPQIDGSISGTSGTNNWFITQTFVTASASDFNSGIASLEVNVNNTGYNPYADTTFTDGIHTIQFRAYDNAGNLTETAIQTIMVDTITPSLSLQVDGTRGQNDFYTNSVTVTPIASDSGSGINKIEASVDNGIWAVINSPLFFVDGNHSYQIRVTDNAGNVTETPIQSLYIDASPAVIAMLDDALMLGDGLFYSIEDSQSGLSELRVVIKDNEGKYKSITWVENLDGADKYKDSVWWDGVFGDGTYPTPGIYFIALKVINGAGVETIRTATIEVPVVKTAEQENIPALVLPPSTPEETTTVPQAVQPSAPQIFGNSNNPFTGNNIQTSFSANSTTTPTQSTTTSNPSTRSGQAVLWGGAASALLGATLAEWQKRREEEAARLAALRNSGGGGEEGDSDAAAKKRAKVMAKNQAKRAQEQAWEAARVTQKTKATQNKTAKDNNLNKAEAVMNAVKPVTPYVVSSYLDKEEETWLKGNESQRAWAAVNAQEEAKKAEQERLNEVYAARWEGLASVAQGRQEKEKNTGGKSLAVPVRDDGPPPNPIINIFPEWLRVLTTQINDKVVQPIKVVSKQTSTALKEFAVNTSIAVQNKYEQAKKTVASVFSKMKDNIKEWVENKVDQTWPALRATGPGENGIPILNENRQIIKETASLFNNLITTLGGIPYKYEYTNGKGETVQKEQMHSVPINPTSLAISISVQAEAPSIIDFLQWLFRDDSPSYGIAQIGPDEYELFKQNIQSYISLDGISNYPYFALKDAQVSTAAMIERISPSIEVCQKYDCTPTDREIVIALSQNGAGFDAERLEDILKNKEYRTNNPETIIDWQKYFSDQKAFPKEDGLIGAYRYYFLNWRASGHNFDTWFMLNRYYDNAMAFEASGDWAMPEGVDWGYIESLIENTLPAQP